MNAYSRVRRNSRDHGVRHSDQPIVDANLRQPLEQPRDMLRPAEKLTPGFDVQDFQLRFTGIDFVTGRG